MVGHHTEYGTSKIRSWVYGSIASPGSWAFGCAGGHGGVTGSGYSQHKHRLLAVPQMGIGHNASFKTDDGLPPDSGKRHQGFKHMAN